MKTILCREYQKDRILMDRMKSGNQNFVSGIRLTTLNALLKSDVREDREATLLQYSRLLRLKKEQFPLYSAMFGYPAFLEEILRFARQCILFQIPADQLPERSRREKELKQLLKEAFTLDLEEKRTIADLEDSIRKIEAMVQAETGTHTANTEYTAARNAMKKAAADLLENLYEEKQLVADSNDLCPLVQALLDLARSADAHYLALKKDAICMKWIALSVLLAAFLLTGGGIFIAEKLKLSWNGYHAVLGMIFLLAGLQILYYPVQFFNGPFWIIYAETCIVLLLFLAAAVRCWRETIRELWQPRTLWVLAAMLAFAVIFYFCGLDLEYSDSVMYLNYISQNIDIQHLNLFNLYTGKTGAEWDGLYLYQGYYHFVSAYVKLLNLPARLFHRGAVETLKASVWGMGMILPCHSEQPVNSV